MGDPPQEPGDRDRTVAPDALVDLIVRQVPDTVVWSLDRDLRFTASLGAGLEAMGLKPNEVVGLHVSVIAGPDNPEVYEAHERALAGEQVTYESHVIGRHYQASVRPLYDDSGEVVGVTGIAFDVTERVDAQRALDEARLELERRVERRTAELKEANARLEREIEQREQTLDRLRMTEFALDAAGDGMFVVDDAGRIIDVNATACERTGFSRDELLAMTVHDIDPEFPADRWPTFWRRLRRRGTDTTETKHRRRDGTTIPVEVQISRFEYGDRAYGIGFVRDISDRLTQQARVRELASRLRFVIESNPGVVYSFDAETFAVDFISPSVADVLGHGPDAFLGSADFWLSLLHPDDRDSVRDTTPALMETGQNAVEYRIRHADGRWVWVRDEARVTRGPDGRPAQVVGSFFDITDRKEAEGQLRLLTGVVEQVGDAVLITDADTQHPRIVYANAAACGLSGYGPDELVGEPPMKLNGPRTDRQLHRRVLDAVTAGQTYRGDVVHTRKDGSDYDAEGQVFPLRDDRGETTHFVSIYRDVTEQRRSSERLRLLTSVVEQITEGVIIGTAVFDPPGPEVVYVNPKLVEMLGYPREELIGGTPVMMYPPHRRAQMLEQVLDTLRTGRPFRGERVHQRKDGSTYHVDVHVFPLRDASGATTHLVGIYRDITAARQTRDRLRLLQTAVEQVGDAVVITDAAIDRPGPRIVYVNPAFERLTGYTAEELRGKTPRLLQGPRSDRRTLDRARDALAAGHAFHGEITNYRKDRSPYVMEWHIFPLRNDAGRLTHWVSIQRDVTERRRAEAIAQQHREELAHVGRLSTLGELASGLAHELNQPLTAIGNYAEGALRRLDRGGRGRDAAIREALERINGQRTHASEVVGRLRSFVGKRETRRSAVALSELVCEAVSLAEHELREHQVEVRLELNDDLPPINIDRVQVEQVVLNLVRNATEAMQAVGPSDRLLVITTTGEPGRQRITIRDRGPGVGAAELDRLFLPFFSTKDHGMGIGLNISQSLIESHGGRLTAARNADGPGMTFTIELPA